MKDILFSEDLNLYILRSYKSWSSLPTCPPPQTPDLSRPPEVTNQTEN